MKYFMTLVIVMCFISVYGKQTIADKQNTYKLFWADEFNGSSLDSIYWTKLKGGASNWNNTAIDDPHVIQISEGVLKLKGIKNPDSDVNLSTVEWIDRKTVWTGAVNTRKKIDFKYGKVDIRARFDSAPRAWPAIWMMPTHSLYGRNPNSGEIDIVEHLNLDPFYYSTIHTEYHTKHRDDPERYTIETANEGDWNVYSIEWDEDKIVFFRNGIPYHVFNKGEEKKVNGLLRWPFDQGFYIILSQQIGGKWVDAEAAHKNLVLKDSDLPITMEVDYV